MGVETPYVRKTWIRNLMEASPGTSTMLIHLAAATCNREAEDLGVVGSAAATYSRGGADITSHDWVIGTELTQFDTDAYMLARAAETLAQCYTPEVAPPLCIFFFCSSSPALQAVQNTRSNKAHVTFFLHITVHITDYHWDRHLYFVIHSPHAQTMTHTPPSADSILILLLVVLVACDLD
jgi:hypothetical protein